MLKYGSRVVVNSRSVLFVCVYVCVFLWNQQLLSSVDHFVFRISFHLVLGFVLSLIQKNK